MGEQCCKNQKNEQLVEPSEFAPYDPTQEPIFPPELKLSDQYDKEFLTIKGRNVTWFRPTTLQDLLELKSKHPEAKLVVGNTEIGIEIRSVGTIGGNIITASPISDLVPILMANRVTLQVQSKTRGRRELVLDASFVKSYRETILEPDEILIAITIPFCTEDQYCYFYKQSRRRDDDIAIVNCAISAKINPKTLVVEKLNLAFGGMSFKTVEAPLTQQKLEGLVWNREILDAAYTLLLKDLPLDSGAPGGMVQYRQTLCLSLFLKAFLAISTDLQLDLDERDLSGVETLGLQEHKSSQYFASIHEPIVHLSAYKQATGEAVYCDDIPKFESELHLAFVISTKAHAWIKNVDPSEALSVEGVCDFISAVDVRNNKVGPVIKDEQVFYKEKVTSQGQLIGGVLAIDQNIARKAAKLVKVEYEEIEPVIVTIQDAIKYNSFFNHNPSPGTTERVISKGNIEEVLKAAPVVIEGECKTGAQEHFYLEPFSVIVVPKKEDGELEVHCTTQNPAFVAKTLAEILEIDQNKVVVKVKRLGGGFGGKDSKPVLIAVPAAIAALKLNCPVRCSLDRDEDIVMTGGRHPFWSCYKAAIDTNGKILGVDIKVYLNGGHSLDASHTVLEKALAHIENAYYIPTIRVRAYICKTNLPSNTAFRGYGAPQGMFIAETIVGDIADYVHKDKKEIMELNLYKEGDMTHYNQKLINCTLDKCWKECLESSNYETRLEEAKKFNRENRYKKRGLSLVCSKYGIAFTSLSFNQGAAIVLIYTDGSILLHHGGVEMGQGLFTKMIQVASTVLEVPVSKIHTVDVSTDKVPNTPPTAASSGSDLYGMAVMEACTTLKNRLKPYKEANPNGKWEDWVKSAFYDRVSLFATGFYKVPNIGHNWTTGEGNLYNYYTYGVACGEVEIDTLTGDHQVRRIDIVMDLGQSLNPAIDVGQIEGAFMQGYGLFLLEEIVCSPKGVLYTRGPGTYKLPGFGDIPGEFNVSLLKGVSNPRAVFSSKAVGEPPLFLGSSAFFAVKNAIKAAREENGLTTKFRLDSPATCERIRMACQDSITQKLKTVEAGNSKPWSVGL
ncbi:Ald Xan dh C, FAD binding 5, and/or CO deh flav C domain containing protein [Asbolus verrucosus]|uniref:Ald Xan dh C, FAD binding 5, and/or CO deh flav C domain containing protein n=1 Tax=Asbolus verrucosus TaxID=1661398 RepID=A0A482VT88_ASBVE|nr:Ald Xan dh C, FAD binding 5, and/or CO deh flav C domain containing protein [Asbolus verrucosus]